MMFTSILPSSITRYRVDLSQISSAMKSILWSRTGLFSRLAKIFEMIQNCGRVVEARCEVLDVQTIHRMASSSSGLFARTGS
jgi:hypothetical protein